MVAADESIETSQCFLESDASVDDVQYFCEITHHVVNVSCWRKHVDSMPKSPGFVLGSEPPDGSDIARTGSHGFE